MRKFSGKQANLLYLMTHAALRDADTDPCDALLSTLREARPTNGPARIREQLRPLRGIGRQLTRFVRELHRKRPWPENLKWPERRLEVFKERMSKHYGTDGTPRRDLTPDEGVALHMLHFVLGCRTLGERREIGASVMHRTRFNG